MGTEVKGRTRTINWNIVITMLHCGIVNVERIHIHKRTLAVVVYFAVRSTLVLLCFLDATVLRLRESELARDQSTIIAFTIYFC